MTCKDKTSCATNHVSAVKWPKCVRCLKLQDSFRKRASNHKALLREMTYKDRAFYAFWPPCSPAPKCDVTQSTVVTRFNSYVWHDVLYVWRGSFIQMTRLSHVCDVTHAYDSNTTNSMRHVLPHRVCGIRITRTHHESCITASSLWYSNHTYESRHTHDSVVLVGNTHPIIEALDAVIHDASSG